MYTGEERAATYSFDDVFVDLNNFRVMKHGQAKKVEPRAFDVLVYLIEHRGRVVEKKELFEQVWKQSFVTDGTLAQEIKNIRRAIGDDAGSPRFIKTIPKHGYRFIAEVTEVTPPTVPRERESVRERAPSPTIAVLPFINLSSDTDNDYFCDGLSEELIHRLAKVKELRVVAHSSSASFKDRSLNVREIGQKLLVGSVLEGSVRRAGDRLRISAQLINTAEGYHLWAGEYDRQIGDLFAIQDDIALAILGELKIELLREQKSGLVKRYTENVEAYRLYLKGRHFWHRRHQGFLQKAMECFQQAIERDPFYALAYTGLADAYSMMAFLGYIAPRKAFPTAKAMVRKALETDETLAEAHTSIGIINLLYDFDLAAAEREFKRALELYPDYSLAHQWYSHYFIVRGQFNEGLAEIYQALAIEPVSPMINAAAGRALCYARKFEAAMDQLQKTIELDPYLPFAQFYLGLSLVLQRRYAEALIAFKKVEEITGGFHWATAATGYVCAITGDQEKAEQIIQEWNQRSKEKYIPPVSMAVMYMGLGDDEKALESLARGYEEHDPLLIWVNVMPDFDFDRLRPDRRFQDLIRRLGLG